MSDSSDPVVLTEVPTEADAILLRDALAEHGVRAEYDGATIAGFRAEAPAMVRVLVAESDRDLARRLMQDHRLDTPGQVDWSQVDVGEPE
ncbi:hypothetical protein [Botrimarina sp.]|uniref:hypothetical protein n=1 Tax=Botrimarina sp. TaxID=2795802 RepID=UPI0032EF2F95